MAEQHIPRNFMLALMKAVENDQNSLTEMQIIDSQSTMLAVKVEANIYEYWNRPGGPLYTDAKAIKGWANSKAKNASNKVSYWQERYNEDSARAQSNESQQDGVVQTSQGQTSTDASNLQMKAQLIQGINSILATSANLLGRLTA